MAFYDALYFAAFFCQFFLQHLELFAFFFVQFKFYAASFLKDLDFQFFSNHCVEISLLGFNSFFFISKFFSSS